MKIRRSLINFADRKKSILAKNDQIKQRNEALKQRNEVKIQQKDKWIRDNIVPLADKIRKIESAVDGLKVKGIIQRLTIDFGEYFLEQIDDKNRLCYSSSHVYLRKQPGEPYVNLHKQLINELRSKWRIADEQFALEVPEIFQPLPPASSILQIGTTRVKIDLSPADLDERLEEHISSRKSSIEVEKLKIQSIRARAAEKESATRELARPFRKDIKGQIALLDCCPYCGKPLTEIDAHLDHIYPVSKGGHSVPANLVFVCSICNLQKKNFTLRHFIEIRNLNVELVHSRLKKLSKDF